jgi:hypothetical protein
MWSQWLPGEDQVTIQLKISQPKLNVYLQFFAQRKISAGFLGRKKA